MYRSNKSIVLFIITTLCISYSANAQIKVVGYDYTQSLSAKDFYSQDVGFETYFPQINPKLKLGYLSIVPEKTINLIGDTVWLGVPHGRRGGKGYNFALCNGRILDTIPSGYYVISGYIFGRENVKDIFQCSETESRAAAIGEIKRLKRIILDDTTPNEYKRKKTVSEYFGYMKMTSIDTTKGVIEAYYHPGGLDDLERYFYPYNNIVSMRFYNEIQRGLLNKEVILVYSANFLNDRSNRSIDIKFDDYKNKKYRIEDRIGTGKHITDDMTEKEIQLQDDVFRVKDVVIKIDGKGDFDHPYMVGMYCILYGEKTGSFARKVHYTSYKYTYEADVNDKGYRGSTQFNDIPFTSRDGWGGSLSIVPVDVLTTVVNNFADSVATKVKIDAMNAAEQERLRKEAKLRWQKREAQEAAEHTKKMIAKYGAKFGEHVAKKQVALNMTKEMVKDAWGRPMNTYRTTTKFGQTEVWCYNYKTRVYFYNGKVVQIDD